MIVLVGGEAEAELANMINLKKNWSVVLWSTRLPFHRQQVSSLVRRPQVYVFTAKIKKTVGTEIGMEQT